MHNIYQHFKDYGFKHSKMAQEHLRGFSEARIENFLSEYKQVALTSPVLAKPLAGATDIYPDSHSFMVSSATLKRLALYANRIYVHDDLLESAMEWPELDSVHRVSQEPERKQRVKRFRANLGAEIEFLLEIKPLVVLGVVHLLPSSALRTRREPNGIYTEDFYGMEGRVQFGDEETSHPLLTPEVLAYLLSETKLKIPALPGVTMETLEEITRCPNRIYLAFKGEKTCREFHFFDISKAEKFDEEGHINMFHARDPFSQNIPPQMFLNWVEGSIRKVSQARVEQLAGDVALARRAGARFTTDLPISAGLLGAHEDRGVNGVLGMELPYFDDVSFKAIAQARKNEDAFEEFRQAFDQAVTQIPSESSDSEFQRSLDELSRDFLRRPLLKIEKEVKRLRNTRIIQGVGAVGTLGLHLVDPAMAPLGLIFTGGTVLAELVEKNKSSGEAITGMPGFFYWQVTHKSAKNKR